MISSKIAAKKKKNLSEKDEYDLKKKKKAANYIRLEIGVTCLVSGGGEGGSPRSIEIFF